MNKKPCHAFRGTLKRITKKAIIVFSVVSCFGGVVHNIAYGQSLGHSTGGEAGVELLALPSFYPDNIWQGRLVAVIGVLDRRDSLVKIFKLPVGGEAAHYKSLSLRASACLQRPNGLAEDEAIHLDLEDKILADSSSQSVYDGWFFLKEPALNNYVSPLYGIRVIGCEGGTTAPNLPPLPKRTPPRLSVVTVPQVAADDSASHLEKSTTDVPRETSPQAPPMTQATSSPLAPPLSPEKNMDGNEELLPPMGQ